MGAVGGLLGLAGGLGGAGQVDSGVNAGQMHYANGAAESALGQQQKLVEALQAQGGLGKQNDVYGQFQNIAQGQGPNPAQAMLNQATAANTANQASLMAGQRGAGANAGLMARQAAMQGAANQQAAVGQGATMQANQSMNAIQNAGNMANNMAGNQLAGTSAMTGAAQAHQNTLLGAQQGANSTSGAMAGNAMTQMGNLLPKAGSAVGAITGLFAGGGQVGPQSSFAKALMTPMATGGNVGDELKGGGHVPGQAKVSGNSYSNDTVKALLSPGEVVIPRSVMQSKDPVKSSAEFVRGVLSKKGKKA